MELNLDNKEYKILIDYLSKIVNIFKKVNLVDGILMKVTTIESDQKYISNDTILIRLYILYGVYSQELTSKLVNKVLKQVDKLYNKTEIEVHVSEYFYSSFNEISLYKHPEYTEVLKDSKILLDKVGLLSYLQSNLKEDNIISIENTVDIIPPIKLK